MIYAIIAAALVAVDQIVKYLVMTRIPLGEHVPFIPYILELTYVTNTGAAFSIFSDHTWALALVSLAMSVVLALALWKGLFKHPLGKLTITLLLAGAVGNLIDRALRGSWWICSTCCSCASPCSTWRTSAWWWGASPPGCITCS